ncbi:MAG: AAA family ATPase [Gemmatimonadaceae bacterium]|nr:AAA family ATPase [Gemmatimonadaceae bacterium]
MSTLLAAPPKILRRDPILGNIIEHAQLRPYITLARMQLKTPGLQEWTGPPGLGKSIAAQQLALECNQEADANLPGAFRAVYFATAGDADHETTRGMKRGVYTVFQGVLEESLSAGEYKHMTENELAEMVVEHCRLMNIQLIVVDEAGTKTEAEMRGMAHITNLALEEHWRLSILLVGMDDLANKMDEQKSLSSRTRRVLVFQHWSTEDFQTFLETRDGIIGEIFAKPTKDTRRVIEILHGACRGEPRELDTLVCEVEIRIKNGASLRHAVETAIAFRATQVAASVAFAREYQTRKRNRRRRTS